MKKVFLLLISVLCFLNASHGQGLTKKVAVKASYLTAMENRLTDEEKRMLRSIYAPVVVGVPPADARADVCVMPDGEIRAYGYRNQTRTNPQGDHIYLSSTDCGLTWKQHFVGDVMGAATYFPALNLWVKCDPKTATDGTYVLLSRIGPDDANPTRIKVCDEVFGEPFLPQQVEGSNRIFFTAQLRDEARKNPAGYFYSDDGCQTFHYVKVNQPKQHEVVYPHKDVRWCIGNGTEPMVCSLSPDRMMMLLRNSTDCFYQSFSEDNGTTWSDPQPSPFQGTNTTPYLLRLSDGRVVAFWNNTRPLAEVDHRTQPNAKPSVLEGSCEDHFTNRDASHVAITTDGGKTWVGARELYLNSIRNNADFRYIGTPLSSNDKSVHQFQAFELPYGKILVAVGQNEASRRFLIFDVNWLFETERHEDFDQGLVNVSTQMYVKSVVGHTERNGHCAYNRTDGAVKAIDPAGTSTWEVVQLSRTDDPRLVSQIQGLVWNFPAAIKGEVEAEIYLAQDAANISLSDCWFNPCDEYAPEFSLFTFHLDKTKMSLGAYHKVKFVFNLEDRIAKMFIDGAFVEACPMHHDYCIGLSYINIQCDAPKASEGLYIKSLRKE